MAQNGSKDDKWDASFSPLTSFQDCYAMNSGSLLPAALSFCLGH